MTRRIPRLAKRSSPKFITNPSGLSMSFIYESNCILNRWRSHDSTDLASMTRQSSTSRSHLSFSSNVVPIYEIVTVFSRSTVCPATFNACSRHLTYMASKTPGRTIPIVAPHYWMATRVPIRVSLDAGRRRQSESSAISAASATITTSSERRILDQYTTFRLTSSSLTRGRTVK